ncbi:MAG: hypothetical protein LBJ70_00090 [Holosporales bacterium]|jgi:hypothetical protein|nr:hypothetical protein [Holosporales bacterium]
MLRLNRLLLLAATFMTLGARGMEGDLEALLHQLEHPATGTQDEAFQALEREQDMLPEHARRKMAEFQVNRRVNELLPLLKNPATGTQEEAFRDLEQLERQYRDMFPEHAHRGMAEFRARGAEERLEALLHQLEHPATGTQDEAFQALEREQDMLPEHARRKMAEFQMNRHLLLLENPATGTQLEGAQVLVRLEEQHPGILSEEVRQRVQQILAEHP